MKLKDISETFKADLQDPEFVQAYLEKAMTDGMANLLLALRNVIQANEGMADIAQEVGVGRESLYKTLSEAGNPHFATVEKLIKALGLRLAIVSAEPAKAS
ncbi:MAG: addiction module antidote protein [Thermosynechococcaceae cyanobacterium]